MPQYEIKTTVKGPLLKRVGAGEIAFRLPSFTTEQFKAIGEASIEVMKDRLATGSDVLDQPAKPLGKGYEKQKLKKGKQPIRDLRYSGNLLGSIDVIEATGDHVSVRVKGSTPYRKGIINQHIDPWFGLSRHDDERLFKEVIQPIFAKNIEDATK